jgi:hypothetical protein
MEEKDMSTVVDGKKTGDVTESGNPNHNADGQFTKKGGSGEGSASTVISESLKEKLQKRLTLKREGPYYGTKIKFDEYSKEIISLKNFKQAVENNRRYHDVRHKIDPESFRKLSLKVKELFEQNECGMRIKFVNLWKVFKGGRFLNLHEAGTGGGCTSSSIRGEFSHSVFGSPETYEQEQRYDFEKYGCLVSKGVKESIDRNMDENQYGDCCVTFKKNNIKGRTTYTLGDSLSNSNVAPSLVGGDLDANSFVSSWNAERVNRKIEKIDGIKTPKQFADTFIDSSLSYTEIQYHGELTIDDVSSVRIPDRYLKSEKFEYLLYIATEKNIPIYTYDFITEKEYLIRFNENNEIVKEEVKL